MIAYLTDNPWVVPIAAIVVLAVLLLVAALMLIQKGGGTDSDGQLTTEELVDEILDNKWGSGEIRKEKLTAAGYDYETVQAAVNKRLGIK